MKRVFVFLLFSFLTFFVCADEIIPMSNTLINAQHVNDYNSEIWCYDTTSFPWLRGSCSEIGGNSGVVSYGDLGTTPQMVNELKGAVVSLWTYEKVTDSGGNVASETDVHDFKAVLSGLRSDGKVSFQGTGVFISDKYILTADHLVSSYMTSGLYPYDREIEVWAITNYEKYKNAYVPQFGDNFKEYIKAIPDANFSKIKMNEYSNRWDGNTEVTAAVERGLWQIVDPTSYEYYTRMNSNSGDNDIYLDYAILEVEEGSEAYSWVNLKTPCENDFLTREEAMTIILHHIPYSNFNENNELKMIDVGYYDGVYNLQAPDGNYYDFDIIRNINAVQGSSGSPVFNAQRELIGVLCGGQILGGSGGSDEYITPLSRFFAYSPIIQDLTRWCLDNDNDNACDTSETFYACDNNLDWNSNNYIRANGTLDNCPGVRNNFEEVNNPHTEIVQGAIAAGNGYWRKRTNLGEIYMWQPDHDLDGVGDACDTRTSIQTGYTISMAYQGQAAMLGAALHQNSTIGVNVSGGHLSPAPQTCFMNVCQTLPGNHRVHYCGLDLNEYCVGELNDDETDCKYPENNTWGANCETAETDDGLKYGLSHATTSEFLTTNGKRWPHISWASSSSKAAKIRHDQTAQYQDPVPAPQNMSKTSPSAYWNWRADIYNQYKCGINDNDERYIICNDANGGIRYNTPVFYNLSSNLAGIDDMYIAYNEINTNYFRNYTTRGGFSDYDTVGKWAMATRLDASEKRVTYSPSIDPGLIDRLKPTYIRDAVREPVWDISAPNMTIPFSEFALQTYNHITKYQNGGFVKFDSADYNLVSSTITLPEKIDQLIEGSNGTSYAVAEKNDQEFEFLVNYAPSSDWHKMGIITNYSDYDDYGINWATAAIYNETVYLAGGEDSKHLYRIIRNGDNYFIQQVSQLPSLGSGMRLISALGGLYIVSDNNGSLYTWEINLADGSLAQIQLGISPSFIRPLNIIGTENGIYMAGKYDPADQNNTAVLKFTENAGWGIIHSNVDASTEKLIMNVVDGTLVMTDILSGESTTSRIELNLSDDSINIEEVDSPDLFGISEAGDSYCLYNDGTFILGGIEADGVCVPFTVPQYHSYSVSSTVYSLAGSENKLAVGTGNAVKIYDITSPLNPVLVHTQNVYGPASDMIVYGDILIVAVENGIDTINLNDYTYAHTATYGTTKALELYNDKLYVGDGQGIKVYDPNPLTLIQQLNTSGDVAQLEIIDGVIYTFEWAGLKRYDAQTLASIQTDSYYVYEPETYVHEGTLYIYKNNSTVALSFSGSSVTEALYTGDETELRNHYSSGSYTYFPEGTSLRISTIEEDPAAICGNGHLETGEICDSSSMACTALDSDYDSGTAYCNSTCNGYNEDNCEIDDGW